MKLKKKFGDKIYIEWVDALELPGWRSLANVHRFNNESFCRTNAFFLEEKDRFVKIAHTVGKDKNNDVLGVLLIPTKWILKVR